jgi:hypothetical protein
VIGKDIVFIAKSFSKNDLTVLVHKDVGVLNGRDIELFLSLFKISFLSCAKKLFSPG